MTSSRPFAGLRIRKDVQLKPYTTFKIGGPARYFAEIAAPQDLEQALAFAKAESAKVFVLGGGSNILVSDRGFNGLALHPVNRGLVIVSEDAETVSLEVNAAETWDQVVAYAVEHGWWGIENLSHIPGQAGAALVQNIGAYGQQLSDVLESVAVMDLDTGEARTLAANDCGLGYRQSIFNTTQKGRLLIFSITLKLARQGGPNLQYPDVRAHFEGSSNPALGEIRQAIIGIRNGKFPFPREEKGGNVGSFFKNLLLSEQEYEMLEDSFRREGADPAAGSEAANLSKLRQIKNKFPTAERIKIPTAFLLEVCGLKRYETERVTVNETQPLVLLNRGGATADDVLTLVRHILRTIHARTGMTIEIEPELVGFSADELANYLSLDGS